MRTISYKTDWSYGGRIAKRCEPLAGFVLDVFYLMNYGFIPSFEVLNEVLKSGGNPGGMSPGTWWKSFEITQAEYQELVEVLLRVDGKEAKKKHPYIQFERTVIDQNLNQAPNYQEWIKQAARHPGDS